MLICSKKFNKRCKCAFVFFNNRYIKHNHICKRCNTKQLNQVTLASRHALLTAHSTP